MAFPLLFPLISALAPIVGGAIGNASSVGDRDSAAERQKKMIAMMEGLSPPDAAALSTAFQKYQRTGEMSPQLQSVISQASSEMGTIKTDPRLQEAQMQALSRLQQLGKGGLQPEDIAALQKAQSSAAGIGQSQQASALQAMQQRGIGGGGNELAARLAGSQAASNQSMQGGLDIQGQASQRALQAIMNSGQLGGQIQDRSFSQQSQQAAAQDAINRFNAMNAQQIQGQDVGEQNKAKYYNLGQAQQIANMNTAGSNETNVRNATMQQQAYNNQYQKAVGMSGAQKGAADQDLTRAGQTQQMWSGIGQGVGQAAGAYGTNETNNNWLKAYKDRTAKVAPVAVAPVAEEEEILHDRDFLAKAAKQASAPWMAGSK